MRRVRWWFLLAVLLAGCINYKIKVATIVRPDGSFDREVYIRCRKSVEEKRNGELTEDPPTWQSFEEPAKPYVLSGSHAEGFTAKATFPAGSHPSGLNRRLYEDREGQIEGVARVEVTDLVLGSLYSYRENVAIGGDPIRFHKELRDWLDFGMRLNVEALRHEMPHADFEPVLGNARKRILPRVEASLRLLREQLERLVRRFRDRPMVFAPLTPQALLDLPEVRLILVELEKYGVKRDPNRPLPMTFGNLMEDDAWEFEPTLIREMLMPLRGVTDAEREELIRQLAANEIELDFEAALASLVPDEEKREKIERDFAEYMVATFGAWVTAGFLDDHELSIRARLPGFLLATNGELGASPGVSWQLSDGAMIFSDPQLFAVSFVPADGFPGKGWTLTPLAELRAALALLDDQQRARLPGFVNAARNKDWQAVIDKAEDDEPVEIQEVLKRMQEAIAATSGDS